MDNSIFYFFFYGIFIVSILGIIFTWLNSSAKSTSFETDSKKVFHDYYSLHPDNPNRNFSNHPFSSGSDD